MFARRRAGSQCGIATFTTDLSTAIGTEFPTLDTFVLAMNDSEPRHAYPPRVRFELAAEDPQAYLRAADFLNVNTVDLQHEYGIFGGESSSHALTLLRELRMPIVSTPHTILSNPNAQQCQVMQELTQISARLVVCHRAGVRPIPTYAPSTERAAVSRSGPQHRISLSGVAGMPRHVEEDGRASRDGLLEVPERRVVVAERTHRPRPDTDRIDASEGRAGTHVGHGV